MAKVEVGIVDSVIFSGLVAALSYILAMLLIPSFSKKLFERGLKGKDLNKPEKLAKEIPESLGIVTGTIFLIAIIVTQASYSFRLPDQTSMAEYNAALTTICFTIFLGFADDVLDLRWRDKIILPTIASLPLLIAYSGPTSVMVPRPLVAYLGRRSIELGILFKVYMCLLTVFCTNSINILAGINGLESGQSFIISIFVLLYNGIELYRDPSSLLISRHLFSISLMAPFAAVTFALIRFNWYPSRVFVGDCFTYFAGVAFAVVGILGHFPKTLMLFFIPQILNFVISVPQLLKIIPCPRHRLPKYDDSIGKLRPTPNLNLVNLFLYVFGPMTELRLCVSLLVFQVICCAIGLGVRLAADIYLA